MVYLLHKWGIIEIGFNSRVRGLGTFHQLNAFENYSRILQLKSSHLVLSHGVGYFISQPFLNIHPPFAWLEHMQQCQIKVSNIFVSLLWSKWEVYENGLPVAIWTHDLLEMSLLPQPLDHGCQTNNKLEGNIEYFENVL